MLACTLFAAPAQAQRERVFVASYGSDSNPCTFGSPCKTFQHAHDTVVADGEVTAIDSAGFGPLVITKGITITSPNGVEAGIAAAPGGNAITINANDNDQIFLHGLTLNGSLTGLNGIAFNSGTALYVYDCVIEKFTQDGIDFAPQTFGSLLVANSQLLRNTGNGIDIQSPGTVIANFDHVATNGNGGFGIITAIRNTANTSAVSINDSVSANNASGGVTCPLSNGESEDDAYFLAIRNAAIVNNGGPGVGGDGCGIKISRSTLMKNSPNFGSEIASMGDNLTDFDGSNPPPGAGYQ